MQQFPDGRLQVSRADGICWVYVNGEETPLQAATLFGQYIETFDNGKMIHLMQVLPGGQLAERTRRRSRDVERLVTVAEADAVHERIAQSPGTVTRNWWAGIRSLLAVPASRPSR